MPRKDADVAGEYAKDKRLRPEDVTAFREWVDKQPHFPPVTELQLILFLQSCYYSIEQAKAAIDTYFTVRKHCPEFFTNYNHTDPMIKEALEISFLAPLPKRTPAGQKLFLVRLLDSTLGRYSFSDQLKAWDMSTILSLHQDGTSEEHHIVYDMQGITFGHLAKIGLVTMKKFMYYLQDGMPIRLKGLHFINVVPFMDKLMALVKPFMKKELMDVLYIHADCNEDLYKYIPRDSLPSDYGGSLPSVKELHERHWKEIVQNIDFFAAEEKRVIDESKRPGKPKNVGDIFGIEGSFKKLDID